MVDEEVEDFRQHLAGYMDQAVGMYHMKILKKLKNRQQRGLATPSEHKLDSQQADYECTPTESTATEPELAPSAAKLDVKTTARPPPVLTEREKALCCAFTAYLGRCKHENRESRQDILARLKREAAAEGVTLILNTSTMSKMTSLQRCARDLATVSFLEKFLLRNKPIAAY